MLTESPKSFQRAQNPVEFHEIFHETLRNNSDSRSPKIELRGLLVPTHQLVADRIYKFKLDTDLDEYALDLNSTLETFAKRIVWEEVVVKGHIEIQNKVIMVEKIRVVRSGDRFKLSSSLDDHHFSDEHYKRKIHRMGKLEPAIDYLAS